MDTTLVVTTSIVLVIALVIMFYFKSRKSGNNSNINKEKFEKRIKVNKKYLDSARNELIDYKNAVVNNYCAMFSQPLIKLIGNFEKLVDAAIDEKTGNVSAIVKFCNHKSFVLAVKKQLKKLSKKIESDFLKINKFLPEPFPEYDSVEYNKTIISNITSIVTIFNEEIGEISKIEKKLSKHAKEYNKLKNPGIGKKIRYFFSSELEKRDKVKKGRIENVWVEYKKHWSQLKRNINDESGNKLHLILDTYITKLIVYATLEQLNFQLVVKKQNIGEMVKRINRGLKSL